MTGALLRAWRWIWARRRPSVWRRGAEGRPGEREAARTLRRRGYRILARNLDLGWGEADLLCEAPDKRTIVLVEVKSRVRGEGGDAWTLEAAVGAQKRRKLVSLLLAVSRANGWEGRPKRIDLLAVEWEREGGSARIQHHEGAVDAEGGLR